jgi:capsular exopolysaccharide synthesis family protein
MSKIHQAMRRAEQEGRTNSSFQTLKTLEDSRHKVAAPEALELARPDTADKQGIADAAWLGEVGERKTALDSRLVAVNRNTYDALAERLRHLKRDAKATGSDVTSILLTSAGVGEGKSLTATNLSIALSRMFDQRVLLVDGNLRHPSIHELLGLRRDQGLSELLGGDKTAGQIVAKTDLPNLFVVTAGAASERPTQLLNTRRMSDFLALARRQFDWVFLDAAALIPEPDAELVSSFTDAIILITGAQTGPSSVLEAIRMLRGKNVLGMVRNHGSEVNMTAYRAEKH